MPETDGRQRPTPVAASSVTEEELATGARYPAKLIHNYETEMEGKSSGSKRLVWYQAFERLDEQWPDGNPVERTNLATLRFPSGGLAGKGSEAWLLKEQFKALTSVSMLPGDPQSDAFVGHFFLLEDQPIEGTGTEGRKPLYRRWPVAYLGPEFEYTGTVRTRTPAGDSAGGGVADDAQPENREAAKVVAGLLSGLSEEFVRAGKAYDTVIGDPRLSGIDSVLGLSLRGGLVAGSIIDRLLGAGLIEIDGETIRVITEVAA